MVAHFPQLHEDVYHTEQVATGKGLLGPGQIIPLEFVGKIKTVKLTLSAT
jgi:hypothetical protein